MPISQQAKETFWTTVPEPVPLSPLEGIRATFEAGRLTDQSTSTHVQLRDDLKYQFARMNELGIGAPDLPWPLTDSSANMALSWIRSQDEAIKARRAAIEGPPDPFLKTADELLSGVKERVALAQERASRAGGVASFVGGLGVGLTDPFNLATMAMGAGAGATLIRKAATEAGIAAVSQLGVEAASAAAKERAGVPVTAEGVLERVATTAVGAAGLVGLFHGAGRVAEMTGLLERYKRGVGSGDIVPTRELDQAAEAIQDHLDTVRPLPSGKAEAAQLDATVAAVDVLSAPTPEARAIAMRAFAERTSAWVQAAENLQGQSAKDLLEWTASARAAGATSTDIARTAAVTAERVGDAVQVRIADRTITLTDPDLVRGKWSISKIQKAIKSRLDEAIAGEQAARTVAEEARTVAARLTDEGIGRREGEYFRNPKQAEAAKLELGDPTLEVVRVGKQKFVLRPTEGVDPIAKLTYRSETQATVDAAIAKQAASPIPPVVEVPLDAPLARPVQSLEDAAMIAEMRTLAEARPDIRVEVDLGDEVLSGNLSEVMARLDQEEAELGDTTDCLLGGLE